ncbi:MAG: DUF350 domain-containing protein [Deltaproteobacteria bacterium]|nr:DUF350 domain-containing protein [Deltaproteobacteria bacterium]
MDILNRLFDMEDVYELYHPEAIIYLFVILVIFYVGKKVYDVLTPYNLNEQLIEVDNKAVALSFAGYMFGLGIILRGVLSGETTKDFYPDLLDMVIWGVIGIALLQISRVVNDKILLSRFDNIKELVEDRNIGTGAVEAGTYIGTALLIMAALSGEDTSFLAGLVSTLIFFVFGQVGFILFGKLYQVITRFDLHAEIEKGNASAGVAFGITLVAIGLLLSDFIVKSDSLVGFAVWFFLSAFLLVINRYLVDKIILPGQLLDEEISKDQNWGAALVEGGMAVMIAFLMNAAF